MHTLNPIALWSWSNLTRSSKLKTLIVVFLDVVRSWITLPPGSVKARWMAGGWLQGITVTRTGNRTPVPNTSTKHSSPSQTSLVSQVTLFATLLLRDINCKAPHVVVGHAYLLIGILPYGKRTSVAPLLNGFCTSIYIQVTHTKNWGTKGWIGYKSKTDDSVVEFNTWIMK